MTLVDFERLAEYAIKRELKNNNYEKATLNFSLNIFKTQVEDKGFGRNVTVWFEVQSQNPDFWDVMPVTIIYKDKQLELGDICERTQKFFEIALKRLNRRKIASAVGEI